MTVERIKRVLQAFAIGDAMGMPTQMLSHERAVEVLIEGGSLCDAPADNEICPGLPGGTITDDTHQLLILVDNLIDNGGKFNREDFADALLMWEAKMELAGSKDLLGPSTKAALLELANRADDSVVVAYPGTTNGAVMRIPAVALAIRALPAVGAKEMLIRTIEVNQLSHNSIEANIGSIAVAAMISAGIDDLDFEDGLMAARNGAEFVTDGLEASADENYMSKLDDVLFEIGHAEAIGGEMGADMQVLAYIDENVGTSLECRESVMAAFAIAHYSGGSVIRAAQLGACLGGDSDTIAAIASAIAAAYGEWGELEEAAWQKVARVNNLDFTARAEALARLRQNYHDDI